MTETKKKKLTLRSKDAQEQTAARRAVLAELKSGLLKAEEVCRIISTCAKSNVAVLKYGDLYVRFGPNSEPRKKKASKPDAIPENPTATDPDPRTSDTAISENAEEIERETHERDELNLREQQIQESAITNPLEFENMLASGDLEDDGTEEA